jgi:hypothetical protein
MNKRDNNPQKNTIVFQKVSIREKKENYTNKV